MCDWMIALLCKPREHESVLQIVALKALGATIVTMSDVVLSRARLPFLEKWCTELGLSNEPVIFQTEADAKARKTSILGKGHQAEQDTLWWIIGKMSIHSCIFQNCCLAHFPCFAENLPYFDTDVDLSFGYVTDGVERHITAVPMNLIAAYMLHALASSQSMGKLLHAFKNVRNMDRFLHENAVPSVGTQPILTSETMS